MKSNNFSDVGVWTVTVQAKLADYTGVPVVTRVFTLTVLDPCLVTTILPQTLQNMTINI